MKFSIFKTYKANEIVPWYLGIFKYEWLTDNRVCTFVPLCTILRIGHVLWWRLKMPIRGCKVDAYREGYMKGREAERRSTRFNPYNLRGYWKGYKAGIAFEQMMQKVKEDYMKAEQAKGRPVRCSK
jgi:hypothetical protein